MRTFKGGAELRLTQQDLQELLADALNEMLFRGLETRKHKVTELSLHPGNKYVARMTLLPINAKLEKSGESDGK